MYKLRYFYGDIIVDHAIEFMYLNHALESGYWHTKFNGAQGIQIYRGSELITEIRTEDEYE